MSIKYRPEIDGLRAIAVLSVVFYHAEMKMFKGGFFGVDVFFVISGYLITKILLIDIENKNFSFKNFYERRARRILPCLFVVMLTTVPFAYNLLLPKSLKEYGLSIVSTMFFSSNIQFWLEDSYIANVSALKPFLHTWSLAVEEQFYLIFPFLILFLFRKKSKYSNLIFGLLLASSLALAEYWSRSRLEAAFFLLPARLWELMGGAILVLLEKQKIEIRQNEKIMKYLPKVGALLLLYSINQIHHDVRHPSLITLIPIVGTIFIIYFANKDEFITRVLSSKPLVSIGLMSYSIYLWHQPVFAFKRSYFDYVTNSRGKLLPIIVTLVLSAASYFLVEKKFRYKKIIGNGIFYSFLGISSLFLVTIGAMFYFKDGYPNRIPTELALSSQLQFTLYKQDGRECWQRTNFPKDNCKLPNEKIIILGDSQIASLIPELVKDVSSSGQGMFDLTWGQCPYHEGIDHGAKGCAVINQKRDAFLSKLNERKIFLIGYNLDQLKFSKNSETGERVSFEESAIRVRKKINMILEKGHRVILIKQVPPINRDTNQAIMLSSLNLKNGEKFNLKFKGLGNLKETKFLNQAYDDVKESPNLLIIDPQNIFCNQSLGECNANDGMHAYFVDQFNHLSNYGARKLLDLINKDMMNKWGESLIYKKF